MWRRLASISLCVAACATLVAAVSVASARRSPGAAREPAFAALGVFAVVGASGSTSTLQVRSATTGALVRDLGPVEDSSTGNGFALSPDGQFVYLALNGARGLQIERVSLATGKRSIVANGDQPAISSDARELAFVAGGPDSSVVAVRDLASGTERRIDLGQLLGASFELLNSSISWVHDGSAVLVLASHVAIADALNGSSRASASTGRRARSCSTQPEQLCLIEVAVPATRPLAARRVGVSLTDRGVITLAADPTRGRAVFLLEAVGFGSTLRPSRSMQRPQHPPGWCPSRTG